MSDRLVVTQFMYLVNDYTVKLLQKQWTFLQCLLNIIFFTAFSHLIFQFTCRFVLYGNWNLHFCDSTVRIWQFLCLIINFLGNFIEIIYDVVVNYGEFLSSIPFRAVNYLYFVLVIVYFNLLSPSCLE